MSRKQAHALLYTLAAASAVFALLRVKAGAFVSSALAFPFEQIGFALRALSLRGGAFNVAAWAVYAAVCASPVALMLLLRRRRAPAEHDTLLGLLSALLFIVMYLMINPAYIAQIAPGDAFAGSEAVAVGKMMLGGAVYSIIVGFAVLRALRAFGGARADKRLKYLRALLLAICAVLVVSIFGARTGGLLDAFAALRAGNTYGALAMSYAFIALQHAVKALPSAAALFILSAADSLVRALEDAAQNESDTPAANVTLAAGKMAARCKAAAAAIVVAQIALNLLQLVFAHSVRVVDFRVEIPLFPLALALAALLLARFFEQWRELKEDSDLII